MAGFPSTGAIIVAAGRSMRMAGTDKLWIDLGGQPLLARTIAAIAATPGLSQLVVVASADCLARSAPLTRHEPYCRVDRWVPGGPTRQDSVYSGLLALEPCDLVLVHDGARPLVTPAVLMRGIAAAVAHGAALAVVPVTDTIKVVDTMNRVTASPDRAQLRAAQTPQIFAFTLLQAAYAQIGAARATCTDDAAIVELAGHPVHTYDGDRRNLKVSTPEDIAIVRAMWDITAAGREP